MAFASPAYAYAFVARLKATPVASASPAYSFPFEARLKAVRRATAMVSTSAFPACSSAFAAMTAVAPQIVSAMMAARAFSFLAYCPSAVGSRNSSLQMISSFLRSPFVGAFQTSSFRAYSYPACCSCHASSPSASCAWSVSFSVMSLKIWISPLVYSSPACCAYRVAPKQGHWQPPVGPETETSLRANEP